MKGITGKLIKYISSYRVIMVLAILCAFASAVFTLFGPQFLGQVTDTISTGIQTNQPIDMTLVYWLCGGLTAIYVINYVLSIWQGFIIATVMQKSAQSLRKDISAKINRLPMKYFFAGTKGDVLSRVTNDVDTIGRSFSQSIGTFIRAITLFLGAIIMMLITNVVMTIVAICSTAIGFIFMKEVMKRSHKYFRAQQKTLGLLNGHIEEMFAGHTVVRAYNGEDEAIRIFNDHNIGLKSTAFKSQALSGLMMPAMGFIGNFGYVCVCLTGALLAANGHITFGVIVAFMLYIRLFTQPLNQIAQSMQNLQSAAAAAERVFNFLEEEELENEDHKLKQTKEHSVENEASKQHSAELENEADKQHSAEIENEADKQHSAEIENEADKQHSAELENGASKSEQIKKCSGEVEFKNVKFGYLPDKTIIKDFSFKAEPGKKIAIVGPTGAGKTTLVNLLMRFYEINDGQILIDGVNTKEITREEVHDQFCMVLQDTWLFIGTLRENLIYTTEGVSEEDLKRATKAVGLHHFVKTLPQGYDTILNDQINLSEGQKQQITIARAILADKKMLILDEATSSVDTRTEQIIQSAMDELMKGRTSFVIAHRLSTIKNADTILVVKDGDIIEQGSHLDLLAQKGFYADLYNAQFEQ
ncbi:ABC transporter [Candidatus Epulonipiscioides saccharophilum]|nr:ABC transporter [Epulopiscium sp. SCG-B10WGA-EpuloB]